MSLTVMMLCTFLDELDSDDVMYFSATLSRFWNLRQEIKFFMESKHQNVAFLSDENLLNDLVFLTDITQHLSDLKLRLQGKIQLVNKLFEHICAFEKKLELFQVLWPIWYVLQPGNMNKFPNLSRHAKRMASLFGIS